MKAFGKIFRAHRSDFAEVAGMAAAVGVLGEVLLTALLVLDKDPPTRAVPLAAILIAVLGLAFLPVLGGLQLNFGLQMDVQFGMPRRQLLPGLLGMQTCQALVLLGVAALFLPVDLAVNWLVRRTTFDFGPDFAGLPPLWQLALAVLAGLAAIAVLETMVAAITVKFGRKGFFVLYFAGLFAFLCGVGGESLRGEGNSLLARGIRRAAPVLNVFVSPLGAALLAAAVLALLGWSVRSLLRMDVKG